MLVKNYQPQSVQIFNLYVNEDPGLNPSIIIRRVPQDWVTYNNLSAKYEKNSQQIWKSFENLLTSEENVCFLSTDMNETII